MADPQPWQEAVAEVWQLFKASNAEFDQRFKESNAEFDQRFKETDAKFKETQAELERRFKETDAKINRISGIFGNQWGRMMESLVEPAALKLFQERGIKVHHIFPRAKSQLNGRMMELDLILENSDEVVLIEIKSNLRVGDVQDFLVDLDELFDFFPKYRSYKVYAGVAGLDIAKDVDKYAYRQGLFVLNFSGEGVVQIKNAPDFQPKDFAQGQAA